jgi:hypothetical protein
MSLVPLLVGIVDFLIGFIDPHTKHKITFPLFGPGKLDSYGLKKQEEQAEVSPASDFSYPNPSSGAEEQEYFEEGGEVVEEQQIEMHVEEKAPDDYDYNYAQNEQLDMPQFNNPTSLSSTGNTAAYIDVNNEAEYDKDPNLEQRQDAQ